MAKSTRTTKKPTTARTPQQPPDIPTNGGPDRAAIAQRAYELYQARGGQHGYEIEDWLQAERELKTGRQDQH